MADIEFKEKVLILGYGAVCKCALPLIFKHIKIPYENVTIMDFEDKKKDLEPFTKKGVTYVQDMITEETLEKKLGKYLKKGCLLIDLAWNIDCTDIVGYCRKNGILYINCSIEEWDPKKDMDKKDSYEKSLYFRHMKLRKAMKEWKTEPVTALFDMGANPGLISSLARQGIVDIAKKIIAEKVYSESECEELKKLLDEKKLNEVAYKCGIKTIHCSELDTQVTKQPKQLDEFVGTWSIEGLREEGTSPAELGWGSHEKQIPKLGNIPPEGPKNVIFINEMGINTWVRSIVPDPSKDPYKDCREIIGMVIRHGEAIGISDRLSVYKDNKLVYRPTVHYAYMPCNETIISLMELRARNYDMQPKMRIMSDDITKGEDVLGALLMGHPFKSWWCGSCLDIVEARKLAPNQNATTLQVAAGLIGGLTYIIKNPKLGVILPDDVPYEEVLKYAKPYLGKFISAPYDWTPLKNRTVYFKENEEAKADESVSLSIQKLFIC